MQDRLRQMVVMVVLVSLLVSCRSATASDRISSADLAAHIEAGTAPLVVDVRSAEEYAAGHIPGAINIPFREMDQHLTELQSHDQIVVYCERGVRANIAEATLVDAGFSTVLHLEGDMSAWRKADLPIQTVE